MQDSAAFAALNGLMPLGDGILIGQQPGATTALGDVNPTKNCENIALGVGFNGASGFPGISSNQQFFRIPPPPPGVGNLAIRIQKGFRNWVIVPDQQVIEGNIYVAAPKNGIYRVFGTILNQAYKFGEVYVFPNPATTEATLHVEVGQTNNLTTRVYDVSGDMVLQARIDSEINVVNGKPCYEYKFDTKRLKPGIYIVLVTAEKDGKETIRKRCRFTIRK